MARNWKMTKIGTNYTQIVKIMFWISNLTKLFNEQDIFVLRA